MSLAIFSFIKNFSSPETSKYFLSDSTGFREVSATQIFEYKGLIVTHDYWMICRDLFNGAGGVPERIIDLDEFQIFVSRDSDDRKKREKIDVIAKINKFMPMHHDICQQYKTVFYGQEQINFQAIKSFHELLPVYYIELCRQAFINKEFLRFVQIEVPCQLLCSSISARGIPIDSKKLSSFRAQIRHDYYTNLRNLSDLYDAPLEVPSDKDVERFASKHGVDLEEYSFDFVLNYLPQVRAFSEAVISLRELNITRGILDSIAVKDNRTHPVLDTQGSRTSRISARSPYLQSLAKRYRSILKASDGYELCYVDFDQFEVGIMAALSGDAELLLLFAEPDMYETFRKKHLGNEGNRKAAKILFLAYAYGMKLNNLPIVGAKFGVSRKVVRNAFKKFTGYEVWKRKVLKDFDETGFVSTSFGNRFYMSGTEATKKERLSAISQVVQGEGSLIFKKALIKVGQLEDVEMLLPMHDALLFQYSTTGSPQAVIDIFIQTMTEHFDGAITGKASIEAFDGGYDATQV